MTPDEMVKHLREKADAFDYQGWVETAIDYELAANIIEELSKRANEWELLAESWQKAYEGLKNRMPRWISVTEQLPEKNQIVVAHEGKGTWDFGMFRGISASGNPEYWHWKKNTFKHVKWWMPKDDALPEPPKEEHDG